MRRPVPRPLKWLVAALFITAAYLYGFPSPTIFYAVVVLLHAAFGVAAIALLPVVFRRLRELAPVSRIAWLAFGASGAIGVLLLFIGTSRPQWTWLYAHMAVSLLAVFLLVVSFTSSWRARRNLESETRTSPASWLLRGSITLLVLALLSGAAWWERERAWQSRNVIRNHAAPETMDQEGDGPKGPFFPSSAQTAGGRLIPGKYFMESDSCQRCHQDIYNQWYASAHHFSSFNNQWYRNSIEYMQDVVGTRPSKWCGGCHDPAVLYSGLMDTPI